MTRMMLGLAAAGDGAAASAAMTDAHGSNVASRVRTRMRSDLMGYSIATRAPANATRTTLRHAAQPQDRNRRIVRSRQVSQGSSALVRGELLLVRDELHLVRGERGLLCRLMS